MPVQFMTTECSLCWERLTAGTKRNISICCVHKKEIPFQDDFGGSLVSHIKLLKASVLTCWYCLCSFLHNCLKTGHNDTEYGTNICQMGRKHAYKWRLCLSATYVKLWTSLLTTDFVSHPLFSCSQFSVDVDGVSEVVLVELRCHHPGSHTAFTDTTCAVAHNGPLQCETKRVWRKKKKKPQNHHKTTHAHPRCDLGDLAVLLQANRSRRKRWLPDCGELGYAAQQPLFSLPTTVYQLMQSKRDI